jgi:hypothetical protein
MPSSTILHHAIFYFVFYDSHHTIFYNFASSTNSHRAIFYNFASRHLLQFHTANFAVGIISCCRHNWNFAITVIIGTLEYCRRRHWNFAVTIVGIFASAVVGIFASAVVGIFPVPSLEFCHGIFAITVGILLSLSLGFWHFVISIVGISLSPLLELWKSPIAIVGISP